MSKSRSPEPKQGLPHGWGEHLNNHLLVPRAHWSSRAGIWTQAPLCGMQSSQAASYLLCHVACCLLFSGQGLTCESELCTEILSASHKASVKNSLKFKFADWLEQTRGQGRTYSFFSRDHVACQRGWLLTGRNPNQPLGLPFPLLDKIRGIDLLHESLGGGAEFKEWNLSHTIRGKKGGGKNIELFLILSHRVTGSGLSSNQVS